MRRVKSASMVPRPGWLPNFSSIPCFFQDDLESVRDDNAGESGNRVLEDDTSVVVWVLMISFFEQPFELG